MDKYGFPIVLFLIIFGLYSLFKPTVYNTYVDQDYLKSLRTCKTHFKRQAAAAKQYQLNEYCKRAKTGKMRYTNY